MVESPSGLRPVLLGGGTLQARGAGALRLGLPRLERGYADSQLDDTASLPRRLFRHRPPFRFHVRARASHASPVGTLGFGLWNDPFAVSLGQAGAGRHLPAMPQALWFFYGSPPSDMAYAQPGVPHGWKAASLKTPLLPGVLVAAGGVGLVAATPLRSLQAWAVRLALSRVQADERALAVDLREWHSYDLTWTAAKAEFSVDGALVLMTEQPPDPPLGFVAWIDNQYGVISRETGIRFGVLASPDPQWLELSELRLETRGAPIDERTGPGA